MTTDIQWTTLATEGGDMGVYEVRPTGPLRGGMIIVHGAFGPNEHVEDLARRFAGYGYHALAPNFYHRTAPKPLSRGEAVDPMAVLAVCMPHLTSLSTRTCTEDLAASITHLNKAGLPSRKIGVVGFCLGGSVAFLAGAKFPLGAVVSFYGGSANAVNNMNFETSPIDMAAELQAPYLGIFGDHDSTIPVAEVEEIREALRNAKVATEVVRYADAGHGFHDDDLPELYQREPAEDAERRTFAWLDRHLEH